MAKKHHEHHGGAWKVAYADFITSMMALFMVMWILIAEEKPEVLAQMSLYFKDPASAQKPPTTWGVMEKEIMATQKDANINDKRDNENEGFLKAIARDFYRMLNVKEEEKEPIDIEITSDGLKMTVYDRTNKPIFIDNTTQLTDWGKFVFQNMAWLIERYNFLVYIDGHTSTGLSFDDPKQYNEWELSADRANTIRRFMEYYAMSDDKTKRVTGFADSKPLINTAPDAEENQRITVSLSLTQKRPATPEASPSTATTPAATTP
jgi:chemotaxis protein MotB